MLNCTLPLHDMVMREGGEEGLGSKGEREGVKGGSLVKIVNANIAMNLTLRDCYFN